MICDVNTKQPFTEEMSEAIHLAQLVRGATDWDAVMHNFFF